MDGCRRYSSSRLHIFMGDHALKFYLNQQKIGMNLNCIRQFLRKQEVLDGGGQGRSRDIFITVRYHVINAKIVYHIKQYGKHFQNKKDYISTGLP